jgi:hypothetical protein
MQISPLCICGATPFTSPRDDDFGRYRRSERKSAASAVNPGRLISRLLNDDCPRVNKLANVTNSRRELWPLRSSCILQVVRRQVAGALRHPASALELAHALPATFATLADSPAHPQLRHNFSAVRTARSSHSIVLHLFGERRFGGKSRHAHFSLLLLEFSDPSLEIRTMSFTSAQPNLRRVSSCARLHQTLFTTPIIPPPAAHAAKSGSQAPRGGNGTDRVDGLAGIT